MALASFHTLILPKTTQIRSNSQIQKLHCVFDSKLFLSPSRVHTKPTTRLSSSIKVMGSSASSQSNQPNTTEIESGIHYSFGFSSVSFSFLKAIKFRKY
jgi:hypothetical protein